MSDNRKNVKSNTKQNTKQNMKPNTKPNTKQNVQKNRPANTNNHNDNNSMNQFMEDVMSRVRDFCDRLRDDKPFATKVSIGAVAVLLLLIVIIAVSCGKKEETGLADNQSVSENGVADNAGAAEAVETDAAATGEEQVSPIDQINAMLGRYFDALTVGDTATITALKSEITEEEIIKEQKKSNYVEKFDNINVLTKDGPTADTYVSFVYYEIKFKDIETMAPGLITLYIYKDEAGEYKIFNGELDDTVKEFIKGVAAAEDVVEIFKRVDVKYNEATAADSALKAFMDTFPTTLEKEVSEALAATQQPAEEQPAEQPEQQPAEEQPAEQAPATEKVVATDTVNVRSSDSENADKLGKLEAGTKVTRYEAKENGWSKIDYEGKEAYVKSEFLKVESADEGNAEQQEEQPAETQTNNDNSEYESVEGKVVILDTVNVRKSGSENAEKLGVAYKGEYYKLLMKQADGWTKIEFNGKKGFVKSEYVK